MSNAMVSLLGSKDLLYYITRLTVGTFMAEPGQMNLFSAPQWRAMSVPGIYKTGQPQTDWNREQFHAWKQKMIRYQHRQTQIISQQTDLFPLPTAAISGVINPLILPAESNQFFRLPSRFTHGDPCIYFVLDRAAPLILYIGETVNGRQRWQGHHDCKTYLSYYLDDHRRYQLPTQIHWAFAWQVPRTTRLRKQLEQALIRHWLPPFNKESWSYWGAPWRIRYQASPE
ncbi:MAG: GIY-YIG nuclease family protein [Gloeomargarita sp. DG02_4_bins_56]